MYWVYYSPLKQPLLLPEKEARMYSRMMEAMRRGTPEIQKAFDEF